MEYGRMVNEKGSVKLSVPREPPSKRAYIKMTNLISNKLSFI